MRTLVLFVLLSLFLLGCTQGPYGPTASATPLTLDRYYGQLSASCADRVKSMNDPGAISCCQASVDVLRQLNVPAAETECPAGSDWVRPKCIGAYAYCAPGPTPTPQTFVPQNVANPASAHCLALGYAEQSTNGESQCQFPNGSSCDEWAFYRGSCGAGYSACVKAGGTLKNQVESDGSATFEYGLCTFKDSTQCGEFELSKNACQPGACKQWSAGGCKEAAPFVPASVTPQPAQAGLANPSATHCTQLGFRYEVIDTPEGQDGKCVFPDGSSCLAWAFFRGECGQGFSACAKAGGKLGARLMGPNGTFSSNSTCQFDDGTICEEYELAEGTCKKGQAAA